MLAKTYCAAVNGLEVTTVTVEVSLNRGVMYHLTGLGDEAVKESRNRISAALQYSGFKFLFRFTLLLGHLFSGLR